MSFVAGHASATVEKEIPEIGWENEADRQEYRVGACSRESGGASLS